MSKEADQLRTADEELETKLAEAKEELFNLRFQLSWRPACMTGEYAQALDGILAAKQLAQ